MQKLFILLAVACILNAISLVVAISHFESYTRSRKSLADTSWPSDHGDVSRSKFTIGSGLPRDFDASKLQVSVQNELPNAQWIYTYGKRSEYLYVIAGNVIPGAFVAKVDARTMEVLQRYNLSISLYIGGLLVHENGNVYCIQANKLYVFWGGDLNNVTVEAVPHKALNGNVVQSNGMLVTQDGLIVIKQWNFQIEDSLLITSSKESVVKLILSLGILVGSIFYFKNWTKENKFPKAVMYTSAGALCGAIFWIVFFMAFVFYVSGMYNPFVFIFDSVLVS
jgi:hypothetical protein